MGGDAHGGAVLRHRAEDHGARGNAGVVPHGEGAQYLGAGTHHHIVAQGGVTLALVLAGAPQGHPLVEQTVVSDLRSLADDNAHAVVDHQAVADGGAGVDFDAGPEPAPLGDAPGQKESMMPVQPMGHPVVQNGMDTRVQEKNLQLAAGRGVAALVGGQQAAQSGYSFCHIELLLVRIGRP